MLRMDMDNIGLLFVSDFKKIAFKGRKGEQMILSKKLELNSNISKEENPILQYYHHLLEQGYTKSYAAILALLLRQKVNGINLRAKSVRVFFEDKSHLKIDLTSPELVDREEDLLNTIINQYKNEREKSIHQAFQTKQKDISFVRNMRDNRSFFVDEGDQLACELMCNDRARAFHLGEYELVQDTLKQFIAENDGKIDVSKVVRQSAMFVDGMSVLDACPSMPEDFLLFHGQHRDFILDGLPYDILEKAEIAIDRHNEQIEAYGNDKKYIKK